jgi:uncharacterized membrane protein (DUF373 family)
MMTFEGMLCYFVAIFESYLIYSHHSNDALSKVLFFRIGLVELLSLFSSYLLCHHFPAGKVDSHLAAAL